MNVPRVVAALSLSFLAMCCANSAVAFAAVDVREIAALAKEVLPIPPYNEWACGRTDDKPRGVASRICRVIYDTPTAPETYDTVLEYSLIESTDPSLLMWVRVAKDAESIHALFYLRERGEWILVDERTYTRKTSPLGKDVPFFTLDSPFGLEYQKLLCQFFEPHCKVWVPTFQFPAR